MPAKRGRPAKPTALKKTHNAGRRPVNEDEPDGPELGSIGAEIVNIADVRAGTMKTDKGMVVSVAAPEHVTGIALKRWNELAPSLATARVLTEWDLDALARYCNLYKTEVQAQKALEDLQINNPLNGLLGKTPNGMLQMNALLIVRNSASRDAHKFGAALGLDPVSRSSIKVEKPEDLSDLAEFA